MANQWERRKEEVTEEDKKKISKEGLRGVLEMYRYVLPYKWSFAAGMLFLLLSAMTNLLFPKLFGGMANVAAAQSTPLSSFLQPITTTLGVGELNALSIVLGGVVLIQGIISFFRIYFFAKVSERTMADIRYAVYKKILAMPLTFFESRRVGELNSRISSDITQLQDVLSVTLAEFLRQMITLVVGIIVLFYWSPKLTGFMLITFPVLVISALVFGRFIRKISKRAQDELANANVVVEETLQAIQVVKAFTNEGREVKRYRTAIDKSVFSALQAATYRGAFVTFVICAIFGGIVLVLWFGASMVQSGEIKIGDLIEFIFYTIFIGGSLGTLGDIYSQLQKTIGASERVREILRETPELEIEDTQPALQRLEGDIQFENVRFAYPTRPELEILKGINLHIQKGQKVGLVGHSGAGKSTITQLLMRFYSHNQGEIKIDGKSVSEYDLTELRRNIGVVPQDVILFGGTIRENIAYGRQNATDDAILDAAKRANALEFIERFPEGLDTIVGERGVKLSGGQRQRIAIARAILKNPAILILDEATSSLDSESEQLVQSALNELMKDRTTLIIAHRLSTIRTVDNIYVLDGGDIVESGTHEALLAHTNGVYGNLVRLQFEMNREGMEL